MAENDTQTVWLVGHDSAGNFDTNITYTDDQIRLYWGNENTGLGNGFCEDNFVPALEATLIYNDGSGFKVRRYALDPDAARATYCNGFDSSVENTNYTLEGRRFNYRKTTDLPPGTYYALRLRLLYNSNEPHLLGVERTGGATFPSQGKCYESTATTETGITRKIRQCQSFPAPPAIFDYVLFSEQNIQQAP